MAYTVQQRTQEIGIRLALGAGPQQMRNMVMAQGMRLALIGVVVGLGAAFGLSRLMASLPYRVKFSDPLVFAPPVPESSPGYRPLRRLCQPHPEPQQVFHSP